MIEETYKHTNSTHKYMYKIIAEMNSNQGTKMSSNLITIALLFMRSVFLVVIYLKYFFFFLLFICRLFFSIQPYLTLRFFCMCSELDCVTRKKNELELYIAMQYP